MRVERYLSASVRPPVIQGAALSSSSRVHRSPTLLARLLWPWVWALTRPGMSSRPEASSVAASGGAANPGGPISRTVSPSTRISAGSAAWRAMSSRRPPRMIVFMDAPRLRRLGSSPRIVRHDRIHAPAVQSNSCRPNPNLRSRCSRRAARSRSPVSRRSRWPAAGSPPPTRTSRSIRASQSSSPRIHQPAPPARPTARCCAVTRPASTCPPVTRGPIDFYRDYIAHGYLVAGDGVRIDGPTPEELNRHRDDPAAQFVHVPGGEIPRPVVYAGVERTISGRRSSRV